MNSFVPSPGALLSRRLAFEADRFVYDRRAYLYANVRHVEFTQRREVVGGHGSPGRVRHESRLRVAVLDHGRERWLAIRLVRPFFLTQRTYDKAAHDLMLDAAETMMARTFDARMDAYMETFRARRHLGWGLYQICPNGDLFKRFAFCMNLRDSGVNCMLFSDRLVCVRKPDAWWKRALWGLVKASETIDLVRDRDCFLYFMRRQLGLWWNTETLRLWHGNAADGSTDQPRTRAPEGAADNAAPTDGAGAEGATPPPPPPKAMATHVQHLATLGLGPDADWQMVWAAYRTLARKHHPDLLRGRGAGPDELKVAEETLKNINEAYGWLEDFFRLKPKAS